MKSTLAMLIEILTHGKDRNPHTWKRNKSETEGTRDRKQREREKVKRGMSKRAMSRESSNSGSCTLMGDILTQLVMQGK